MEKIKKLQLQYWFIVTLAVIFTHYFPIPDVSADSLDTFDVEINLPNTQRDQDLMYFDLILEPSDVEELVIIISNKSEDPIKLEISFNRAVTNMVGVVEYSGVNDEKISSAPYDIEEVITLSDENLSLEAKEKKEITLTVNMPDKFFDGILAGGLYVQQTGNTEFQGNVQNLLAREVAVLLRNKETKIAPVISIEGSYLEQVNRHSVIVLEIKNKVADYLSNTKISYEVFHNGQETDIKGEKEVQLAPNALMSYVIDLGGNDVQQGEYEVKTKINYKLMEWTGNPQFQVKQKQAKQMNDEDATIEEKSSPFGVYSMVIIILFIVIIGLFWKNSRLKKSIKK